MALVAYSRRARAYRRSSFFGSWRRLKKANQESVFRRRCIQCVCNVFFFEVARRVHPPRYLLRHLATILFVHVFYDTTFYSIKQTCSSSIPIILVRVHNQSLHKPHRLHQRIRPDVLIDRMNASGVRGKEVSEPVDVLGQVPVSLRVGVSTPQRQRTGRRDGAGTYPMPRPGTMIRSVWSASLRVLHVALADPERRFHAGESVSDGETRAGSRLRQT